MKRRQRKRRRANRPAERRGVLLLVVLSMLVLFLLVGTTFLVTSGQYRTASKVVEKANRATFQPADLLERALMQVVRDTNNRSSAIRYHSLLRDLYGVDGFVGRVASQATVTRRFFTDAYQQEDEQVLAGPRYAGVDPTASTDPVDNLGPTAGQIVEVYVRDVVNRQHINPGTGQSIPDVPAPGLQPDNFVGLDVDEAGIPLEHQLSAIDGYYEGCLLTMLDGPCRGQSVRILDYEHLSTATENDRGTVDESDDVVAVEARFRFIAPQRVDGRRLQFGPFAADANQTVLTDFFDENGSGRRFMVNGRPYNGAGVGYNVLAMAHDLAQSADEAPRLSAVERFQPLAGSFYGLERALTPNPVYYNELLNYGLNPAFGEDPWRAAGTVGDAYTDANAFRPLTRQFVDPGTANYDPDASPLYKTFAGPGDTDESYDAADYQNMFLALQSPEPRARGRAVQTDGSAVDPDAYYSGPDASAPPRYLDLDGVTIPSFHRPALANFWFHRLYNSSWLRGVVADPNERARAILEPYNADGAAQHGLNEQQAAQVTAIKRKFIMRPLREDHPSFNGSNPLSEYGTNALRTALENRPLVNARSAAVGDDEITFPAWETVGPWDIDNDNDGVPDSVWVDIGLPVQQTEDGRFYKPLVALLVEDLDGRLNLNAHGSEEHLASPTDPDESGLDLAQNLATGALIGNLARDYLADRPLNSSDQLPTGGGWGPADISLRPVLSPTLLVDVLQNTNQGGDGDYFSFTPAGTRYFGDPQYDEYARLLRGRPDPDDANRTVRAAIDLSATYGRYGAGQGTNLDDLQGRDVSLARPGRSATPGATDDVLVPGARDPLTPLEFLGYQDVVLGGGPSGFALPPDLRGRYATALSPRGGSVNEPTDGWRADLENTPDDSPYELDLSAAARRVAPASLTAVVRSYDADENGVVDTNAIPLDDDAPFSPAELERLLRALDADADTLPDRLWNLVDAFDPEKFVAHNEIVERIRTGATSPVGSAGPLPSSLETLIASARSAINRRLVTTDSYDLPSPNENWTARLIVGADGLPGVPYFDDNNDGLRNAGDLGDDDTDGLFDEGDESIAGYDLSGDSNTVYDTLWDNGCDDYVVVMRDDPPSPARITDYLRYRVVLELKRTGRFVRELKHTSQDLNLAVNQILFGDDTLEAVETSDDAGDLYSFGGLLAPELLAGRRMDLNRPWGDGRDNGDGVDNNGNGLIDEREEYLDGTDPFMNGVVDEPQEAGEPYVDSNGDGSWQAGEPYFDRNRNRAYDPPLDFLGSDENLNGVIDPAERRPFNYTRGADVNGRGTFVDSNGDGEYTPGEPVFRDDARLARQLYARHLYCLMLLLTDENYLAPYDPDDPQTRHYLDPQSGYWEGPPNNRPEAGASVAYRLAAEIFGDDPGTPAADPVREQQRRNALVEARARALRKLTRRAIAQWAINVVDFRDADAIQTPFEYDENPWDGWNVVDTNNPLDESDDAVYPIDGDLATDENYAQRRDVAAGGFGDPIPTRDNIDPNALVETNRTRGVVWGAERPELIITEGLAWHDRRLEDLQSPIKSTEAPEGEDGGTLAQDDDDLDQLRKPKGFTFLELYNPWTGDSQRPAEFYSHVDREGNLTVDEPGVRLDRLSNQTLNSFDDPTTANVVEHPSNFRSPVWRFACVEEHPNIRNSSVISPTDETIGTLFVQLPPPQRAPISALLSSLLTASDDPYTPLVGGSQQDFEYADELILGSPWSYNAAEIPSLSGQGLNNTNVQFGNGSDAIALPRLPPSANEFWFDRLRTSLLALVTTNDNIEAAETDADGLAAAVGIIESPPLIPSTAWPEFDRYAQPDDRGARWQFVTSSRVDGADPPAFANEEAGRTIDRITLHKPNRFIERVFYPTSPNNKVDRTTLTPRQIPLPDLVDPGFHIPLLTYTLSDISSSTSFADEALGVEQAEVLGPPISPLPGAPPTRSTVMRVHVSKFAALNLVDPLVYSQFFDEDLNGTPAFDSDPTTQAGRLDIVLAPLLPGRRAVVGTTGTVYRRDGLPSPDEVADDSFSGPTLLGTDARKLEFRYATLLSRLAGDNPGSVPATFGPGGEETEESGYLKIRRFEMLPNPEHEKHQFAVRWNGFLDSQLVRQTNGRGFNVTVGESFGLDGVSGNRLDNGNDDSPVLLTSPPVIAVPIDNMSISEPIDQYLARQMELDTSANLRDYDVNLLGNPDGDSPPEGFFASDEDGGGQPLSFDVPFDILPELVENQTTPNYRSLHLERLANPLMPWNPDPIRPNGQANAQHEPTLPVNPYIALDSFPLDLTSVNSYSSATPSDVSLPAESTDFVHLAETGNGTEGYGPENRHRKARGLPGSGVAQRTEIGFSSIERGRPLGAIPLLWAFDTPRLLWRQTQGSTTSEYLRKDLSRDRVYTVDANDAATPSNLNATSPYDFSYDAQQLTGLDGSAQPHVVDFPWRMTLGFASRLWGEFYTGSGLRWRNEGAFDTPAEFYDLDGDGAADLPGAPEVNSDGAGLFADSQPNGRPDAAEGVASVEQFEQNALLDESTTPELRWPNRPFLSAGELLQVPAWGGSRMLTHFSVFNWQHTQRPGWRHYTQVNPYNGEDGGAGFDHDGLDYSFTNLAGPATFNHDFADDDTGPTGVDQDGFREQAATNELRFRETLGHFGHLPNFFQTARFPAHSERVVRARPAPGGGTVTEDYEVPRGAAHFYRLLDYVTVPSRFTATETRLSPEVFGEAGVTAADPRAELSAPFNTVDRYREPGRVNLNTVVGRNDANEPLRRRLDFNSPSPTIPAVGDWWSEVYDGLMHRYRDGNLIEDEADPSVDYNIYNGADSLVATGHLGPAWRDVALSRRGYVQPTFDPTIDPTTPSVSLSSNAQNQVDYSPRRLHPDFPTLFANPFRSPGEGGNVPLAHMVRTGVDATLLRAHPLSPGADGAWGQRGRDDNVVDRSNDNDDDTTDDFDLNGVRDDADEAGVVLMTIGGGASDGNLATRLSADVLLSRFHAEGTRRGALPDTFLEDAFVNIASDTNPFGTDTNRRDVSIPASQTFNIRNAEISRRVTPVPLFSGASLEPSQDTERNATMRYQPIERLANLTTTRSGVFAVWITVGLFEVSPAREDARIAGRYLVDTDNDGAPETFRNDTPEGAEALEALFLQVYQDGYTLGKELDIDTGENRRYRGFYLVDRTRPVAFRPGDDANVDDAVLLRRRLQ